MSVRALWSHSENQNLKRQPVRNGRHALSGGDSEADSNRSRLIPGPVLTVSSPAALQLSFFIDSVILGCDCTVLENEALPSGAALQGDSLRPNNCFCFFAPPHGQASRCR